MDAPFAVRLVRYAHTLLVVATTLVAAARPRTVRRHLRNTQVAMKIAKAEDRLRGKHPKLNLPGSSPRRGAEVRRVSLRRTRPGQRLKIRMSDFGREAARQRARLYEHHATWVRWRIVTGHQHRLLGSHAARKAGGVGAEVPTSQAAEPVWARRTASVDVGRSVNVPNGTVTAPTRIRACSRSSRGFASLRSRRRARRTGTERSGPPRFWPGVIRQLSPAATLPAARSARARVSIHRPS